jgi:hypothetical protein
MARGMWSGFGSQRIEDPKSTHRVQHGSSGDKDTSIFSIGKVLSLVFGGLIAQILS